MPGGSKQRKNSLYNDNEVIYPGYSNLLRNKIMKRHIYIVIVVIFLFILSSCTLLLPAMVDARIVKVEHQDLETLSIFLRYADEGYQVKVGDQTYDCSKAAEPATMGLAIEVIRSKGQEITGCSRYVSVRGRGVVSSRRLFPSRRRRWFLRG